jgi:DNA-nicking Smr family endonuclease
MAATRDWLTQGPLRRHVLAFTSAPPTLGGTGAMLVLLRRPTDK